MAALFSKRANGVVRGVIFAAVAGVIGVPAFLMVWVRTPYPLGQFYPIDQPVQFDHRHHYGDDGIGCLYCHSTADRAPTAGMPPTGLCMGCHNQIWNSSPQLAPVLRSYFAGLPISWNRVTSVPDFVYFNHAIHVTRGVGCVTCHGRVDLMARVYQVAPLTMGWCLDCHRAPERYLRPIERVADMSWRPDRPQLELGLELKRKYGVRELTTCTACHR